MPAAARAVTVVTEAASPDPSSASGDHAWGVGCLGVASRAIQARQGGLPPVTDRVETPGTSQGWSFFALVAVSLTLLRLVCKDTQLVALTGLAAPAGEPARHRDGSLPDSHGGQPLDLEDGTTTWHGSVQPHLAHGMRLEAPRPGHRDRTRRAHETHICSTYPLVLIESA